MDKWAVNLTRHIFCMLQGCAAAAVFWLHWFTYRGAGRTADIPRGAARVHLTERVRSLFQFHFFIVHAYLSLNVSGGLQLRW